MDEEVVRFWRAFEEETGERVEAKSMGELYEDPGGQGVWGLLVLTDRSLRFRPVPSTDWMGSLFRPRARSVQPAARPDLRIPRDQLVSLVEPGTRRWFFRPAFPVLTVTWREDGELRTRRVSVDPSTDLLARLRELCPAADT